MSLVLSSSEPHVEVKTNGKFERDVWITTTIKKLGKPTKFIGAELTMGDFCEMVKYVMTNTDLNSDDPRLELVRWVSELKQVRGYNINAKRLSDVESGEKNETQGQEV